MTVVVVAVVTETFAIETIDGTLGAAVVAAIVDETFTILGAAVVVAIVVEIFNGKYY